MSEALRQLQKRNKAKKRLAELIGDPERIVVIHYSCEDFYNRPNGSSPRITSIAVKNLANGQTSSFSIHQMAEKRHIPFAQIGQHYDELEKLMLDRFYEYVRAHSGYTWLHWNMRDVNYGFHAIAHRYEVLSGQPVEIHESQLEDLSRLIVAIYGLRYINHPRLPNLVQKNDISTLDFLSGAEEAAAFNNKEYVKLHLSTLRKVEILANIAERADMGILKTNTRWIDIYRLYPQVIGEWLKEHWLASLISFIIAVIGLILGIVTFMK